MYLSAASIGALRDAEHLGADADAALVQSLDRNLVAFADLAEHIFFRNLAVVENQLGRRRRADAELVFLFADRETFETFFDDERRDAFVACLRIDRCKKDKNLGFVAVRDPEFLTGELEMIAFIDGAGFQRKGVRTRSRFAQGIGADFAIRPSAADIFSSVPRSPIA